MRDPVVAAYYPSWKIYKGCKPSDLRLDLLDYSLDPKADFSLPVDGAQGCMGALQKIKKEQYPHLRVLLSIGGSSGSEPFPIIAADDGKLHAFCKSLLVLLEKYDFDGVDIDWEHPSNPQEGQLFFKLIKTLRHYLPRPRYTITTALPVGEWCLRHIDLTGLLSSSRGDPCLDYLHVMAYDFAGPWTEFSGHQAQLYAPMNPVNEFGKRSVENVTSYLVNGCSVDPFRIMIGCPAYGRSFRGVSGPGQKFCRHSKGTIDTFDYCDLPRPGSKEIVDRARGGASCLGADGQWITYDSPATVHQKGQFVKEKRLGGMFFWTGSSDAQEESRSLVVAGHKSLKYRA
ncbi:hypothetical protein OPT61_g841 [Boeremia exigua]|uniref:Uncharacterized protein n=1 Tax=Boeremia exigua TaxID=749465 RepID=A0ACC2ISG5_9PLEO|nr:hypothetical protein OPT61_g841 [Boeremia exigua]